MKILLYSPAFVPSIGGLETVVALCAEGFARSDHAVTVVTTTRGEPIAACPYAVVRRPRPGHLLRLVRWCDVFFQANVSLRGLWPLLLVRRPWVVSHHSWYCRTDGRIAWQDRLKRFLLRYAAASIAVSRAMAADLPVPSIVIGNPYRDDLFRRLPGREHDRDLVSVGRLVSDKGVDLLLDAVAALGAEGLRPELTVIGDGPERPALEAQAARLGIAPQITFAGTRTGEELVELLNRHRILVVPSRYHEPFGVVALEGIACGCAVVGSDGGGLPEAIGPCGRTFPNGDAGALAALLAELLASPAALSALLQQAPEHLAGHSSGTVARAYLAAIEGAVGPSSTTLEAEAPAP
jgi:glycogen synthase